MKTNSLQLCGPSLRSPRRSRSRLATLLAALLTTVTVADHQLWAAPPVPDKVTTFPDIPGAQTTAAYGINDRKQIVGTYYDGEGLPHGFVLSR